MSIAKCFFIQNVARSLLDFCFFFNSQLGWEPLMESYMDGLPETLTKEQRELVRELFNWLIQPCLGTLKKFPLLSEAFVYLAVISF